MLRPFLPLHFKPGYVVLIQQSKLTSKKEDDSTLARQLQGKALSNPPPQRPTRYQENSEFDLSETQMQGASGPYLAPISGKVLSSWDSGLNSGGGVFV